MRIAFNNCCVFQAFRDGSHNQPVHSTASHHRPPGYQYPARERPRFARLQPIPPVVWLEESKELRRLNGDSREQQKIGMCQMWTFIRHYTLHKFLINYEALSSAQHSFL